ncbi:GntR family transcriptional regulator [Liquorilactobacillus vini]|uniref:Transcriptional regulator n=1 Tax=Liquorilactobacillus vini DSM 20605 TaxID=1133569 RepID=A0A0R2CF90_9LACO|nr:GntR family transcriptional regulator [Liquorilactobacillus vini]KRM86275.1 transcriptional regulator [Liquorilactobacillus vini DSM 20605]
MKTVKYQFVAETIRQRILKGVYKAKSIMPDQNSLASEFNVSRLTVKKALDLLAHEGLIYKQSGLGTIVLGVIPIKAANDSPANAFDGLSQQHTGEKVESKIISFEVHFPNQDLQTKLDIKKDDPVYEIRRLRILNGDPLILEHTFMPVKLVPGLNEDILHKSVYGYLHQQLHLKFGGAYRKIRATLPDKLDIKYLQAQKNDPMLEFEEIVWLNNGENIEYATSRNRYDKRSYTVLDVNDF